jgi:hypothetical protein
VKKCRWHSVCALMLLGSLLIGCSTQAPYMRGWQPVSGISHRWSDGTIKASKLSDDEATVYQELGAPDAIRFFRTIETRQKVYEWVYVEQDQLVWFADRKRVEYVAVDTNTSGQTKEARENTQSKLISGAAMGAVVWGVAAGFLLLGSSLGLTD